MGDTFIIGVAGSIIVILFGVIGYLLQRKDQQQEHEISEMKADYIAEIEAMKIKQFNDVNLLWQKHDEDASRLHALELDVAKQYYPKGEMDYKFDKIELTLKTTLEAFSNEIRKLNGNLMDFMARGKKD